LEVLTLDGLKDERADVAGHVYVTALPNSGLKKMLGFMKIYWKRLPADTSEKYLQVYLHAGPKSVQHEFEIVIDVSDKSAHSRSCR
jgi:hypothetical protein